METTFSNNKYPFLSGGGEMGQLIRQYDWSTNALGTPDAWPLSLRTTLNLLLNSTLPMFLFWGDDLISFCNDAYRSSLTSDGKRPDVLGKPGAEAWSENWGVVGPLIEQVIATGESVEYDNQQVPRSQNDPLADVHCMFAISPAFDDGGQFHGALVTWVVTTQQEPVHLQQAYTQHQLHNLLMQAPVAIAIFQGPEYIIELANEAHLAIWGRQAEEVLGKPLFDALPEAKGQGYEELLAGVLTTGEPFHANELSAQLIRNGQSERVYFNFVYQALRELDGTITGVIVLANDITETVLARHQLEVSEAHLRSLVESAPFPIGVYIGREMRIQFVNQSIIDVWGKGPDVVGQRYAHVLPELAGQGIYEQLERVYDTGVPFHANNQRVDIVVDGQLQPYYFKYSFTPLFDAQGHVYGVMNTAAEVTDLVLTRQELQFSEERYRTLSGELEQLIQQRTEELAATNEELAAINEELTATNEQYVVSNEELLESTVLLSRSNANLEQFAYVASHDLQEPLRKIQQFGDLLKGQYADQLGEGTAYLDRMQSAASRMSTLIRDLLTFSRIATQQETRESVSLSAVINTILTDLELVITETGADVQVGDLPAVVGDPLQLGQLFSNLLSNALKFRRPDVAPVVQIRARWLAADHLPPDIKPARGAIAYHLIEVADNGIGFDEKYRDRMFQVFQRLHGRSEYAGTGIGLAICQKVVTNHGGAITAASQPGQGATFSVYLPV